MDRYNEISRAEMEHVRDFIILHYHANQRDEPMWKQCREMTLPDSLAHRIAQFRERAHAWQGEDELFRLDSWTHVMLGQGIVPQQHHPLARGLADDDMRRLFDTIRQPIGRAVATHAVAPGVRRALLQGVAGSVGGAGGQRWRSNPSSPTTSYILESRNHGRDAIRTWNANVGNGGAESACGWCKDKWGLSWQITARVLLEAITNPDLAAAKRNTQ